MRLEAHLRQLEEQRKLLAKTDEALQQLSPEEQLILQMLVVAPRYGNAGKVAQMLHVELGTVYKKKLRLMRKLERLLGQ